MLSDKEQKLLLKLNDVNNEAHNLRIENSRLKELLKDLISETNDCLQAIQKDCECDDFSIYNYPEVQNYELLKAKINQVLGEE